MANNKVRRNGSYAPLSSHYYKDDAVAKAGEKAELLYIRGLAFCSDVLSDGLITDTQLSRFVGVGLPGVTARANKLVEVGLWARTTDNDGYIVTSWSKWNYSRDEIQEKLRRDSARKTGGQNDQS